MDEFIEQKDEVDYKELHDRFDFEVEMYKDTDGADPDIQGRMSPWGKEELYRSYLQGTTIKDLSLKYGILPQRVKAIIF